MINITLTIILTINLRCCCCPDRRRARWAVVLRAAVLVLPDSHPTLPSSSSSSFGVVRDFLQAASPSPHGAAEIPALCPPCQLWPGALSAQPPPSFETSCSSSYFERGIHRHRRPHFHVSSLGSSGASLMHCLSLSALSPPRPPSVCSQCSKI